MANKIFPQIDHTVLLEGIDLFLNKRVVLLPDGNGGTVEKLLVTVLALDECQLRLSAFSNIGGDPCDFFYFPGIVEDGEGTIPDPAQGAIRPYDAVLQLHLLTAFFALYGLQDGRVFDFISRTTPAGGEESSFIGQIFKGVNSFNPFS